MSIKQHNLQLQWLNVWKSSIKKKNQYWKHISNVNLSHKSLKELRKINKLTFSIFIQLKMKHDYFKSYLHRLLENNLNKCYEICNARQTLKHLLLNCRHYRAEQRKLKKKAQLKNTDTIMIFFYFLFLHYNDIVHHQEWKNHNTKVFEKYLNYDEKMTIRNESLERKECEETKKNKSMIARVEARVLVYANYRCDWSTRRYKAATLIKLHVT